MSSWRQISQRFACILCVILAIGSGQALAVNVALVVGNSKYQSDSLPIASSNATSVASALERRGFDVVLATDPSFFEFQKLISNFGERSSGAELSVFYYAGHGIVLSDNNYLIPTDIHLRARSDYRKLPWLQEILIAGSEAQRSVTFLDTCFTSDFAKGWGERFGRSSLCPDNDPRIALGDESTVIFTSSQSRSSSSQSEGIYASTLASEIDTANSLLMWLDETARIVGTQTTSDNQPVFFGSRTDVSLTNRVFEYPNTQEHQELASIPIEAGEYELSNLFRSRKLVDNGSAVPVMGPHNSIDSSAHWYVRQVSASSFSMFNVATNRFLAVSENGTMQLVDSERGASTTWTAIPVEDGLENEVHLFNAGVGQFFRASGSAGRLSVDYSSSSAGWLLEFQQQVREPSKTSPRRVEAASSSSTAVDQQAVSALTVETVPDDTRIRILNILPKYADGIMLASDENYHIEVSKEGFVTETRWVRLEEKEVLVRIELQSSNEATETVEDVERAVDNNSQLRASSPVSDSTIGSEVSAVVGSTSPAQDVAPDNVLSNSDSEGFDSVTVQTASSDSIAQLPAESMPVPRYSITSDDRNSALARFNEVSAALSKSDPEFLTSNLPDGDMKDILNQLSSQYSEIDARIITLNSDDNTQSVSASFRLMRLVRPNGDIVTPAESYRDFSLMQTRSSNGEWSELLWAQ